MAHTLLQKGLFDGFSCAGPQFVLPAVLGDHHSTERVFGRRPGREERVESQ